MLDGLCKNTEAQVSENSVLKLQRTLFRTLVKIFWIYIIDLNWKPRRNYIDSHKVAIVCSARSGSTKALGTTNLLLRAASEALTPRSNPTKPIGSSGFATPVSMGLFGPRAYRSDSHSQSPPMTPTEAPLFNFVPLVESGPAEPAPAYHLTVDLIRSEHLAAARLSVRDPVILKELQEEIERDCEWLRNFLLAAKVCFT